MVPILPQTRVTMACSNRGGLRVELVAGYWRVRVRFAYLTVLDQIEQAAV
jgi:hypothetical protein